MSILRHFPAILFDLRHQASGDSAEQPLLCISLEGDHRDFHGYGYCTSRFTQSNSVDVSGHSLPTLHVHLHPMGLNLDLPSMGTPRFFLKPSIPQILTEFEI